MVLAAGASSRMGRPKALLPTAEGRPLASVQADLLRAGGCVRVIVVLGSDYQRVSPALPDCERVENPDWAKGRFTSIQAGLRVLADYDGVLILPVDTVGLRVDTVRSVLAHASTSAATAVRPTYGGRDGKLLWISRALADELRRAAPEDRRLDEMVRSRVERLALEDPALWSNVNTPEDLYRGGD